jgi:hypothetical protein
MRPILLHPLRHLRLLSRRHPSALPRPRFGSPCLATTGPTECRDGVTNLSELRVERGFLLAEGVEDLAKAIRHEGFFTGGTWRRVSRQEGEVLSLGDPPATGAIVDSNLFFLR